MRFATVTVGNPQQGEATTAAVWDGTAWRALPAPDLSTLLATTTFDAAAALAGERLTDAEPVLPLPSPHKVICCGLNYADHITETGRDLPTHPTLFAKFADTLTGPTDELQLPEGLQIDWEVELAVVVGAPLRRADRDTARAGIAGYTIANDISIRDWQRRTLEWFQGKAWDATTPLGPIVVTPDEVDPFDGLDVTCRVNGRVMQHDNTKTLVFDAADLLSYISTFTRLMPGDVVLTGTPGGVGMARDPQVFLTDGDVVECEITGLGTQRNLIRLSPNN